MYFFTALHDNSPTGYRFVVFGDLGNANAQSLPSLQMDTQNGMYDMVLHVGECNVR